MFDTSDLHNAICQLYPKKSRKIRLAVLDRVIRHTLRMAELSCWLRITFPSMVLQEGNAFLSSLIPTYFLNLFVMAA